MSRSGGTVAIPAPDFNLALTLESGQVFHWTAELVKHYFALDHPLSEIYATFPSDPAMAEALQFCRGLRIVRQPPWECLATFITSALKQVPHIKQISHCLRERFGKRIAFEGRDLFAYPAPERIASLTETDLRDCKLGFRAKNLLGTARMIASGEVQLERVASMPDHAALAELCRLPGVGPKIANCVLLFAYGRLKAFPIDVWIERVLREIYFKRKRKVTARRLLEFSQTYFGAFGGYAQQYLFHHARKTWRLRK
jgi:N-glycosylase/DNA lyase